MFREDIVMKMCRNCVRFPEDGNIANHVRTLFLDDSEEKKSTNVTCILQMSGINFKTLHALNYSIEKRSYILFKLYIFLQFAKTLICQGHLCPLPLHVAPVYWSYDNALRIYPVPDLIVCADKYDPFSVSQLDTHVVNPVS